jgi:effector-binding domain-containing protein
MIRAADAVPGCGGTETGPSPHDRSSFRGTTMTTSPFLGANRFRAARAPAALLSLCATAIAEGSPDAATAELLDRVEAARGRSTKALDTLAVEATIEVRFDEAGPAPLVTGSFREAWAGRASFRHSATMEGVAVLERGFAEGVVFEIEPNMGATVQKGAGAKAWEHFSAVQRGTPVRDLYRVFANEGTRDLDGVPHVLLKLTPPEGDPDTWWIEPKSARVARVDVRLPVPRDCVVIFGFPEWSEARLSCSDWRRVDGADFAGRRVVRIGSMETVMTATKVERGVALEPGRFMLPEAVVKAAARVTSDSPFEIVERVAQPTLTVRFRCRRSEYYAKLATVFPEVIGCITAQGGKMAGVPFTRYHGEEDGELDLEAGIAVVKAIEGKGRVRQGELPGGRTLVMWHLGPYDQLEPAHEKLRVHAEEQGLEPRGGAWESYWTDAGMVPDPAKWRSQHFLPIE